MPSRDPRVDAYIAEAPDFARPILEHVRAVVHAACPTVEETIKWGMPFFMHEGMLCNMAAFKHHCALGFRHAREVLGSDGVATGAMGSFGRLTSVADLPPRRTLAGYVRRAMAVNERRAARPPARRATPKSRLAAPRTRG